MQTLKIALACCLLATTANAAPDAGSGSAAPATPPPAPTPPTATAPGGTTTTPAPAPAPPTDGTATAPGGTTTTTTTTDGTATAPGGTTTTDGTAAPQPPTEPVPPPPPVEPTPPPPPVVTTTPPATAQAEKPNDKPSKPRCNGGSGAYYNCERPYGIFHNTRLVIGGLSGDTAVTTMDPATGTANTSIEGRTAGVIAFEGAFLGIPSSFAPTNFHGIEFSTGMRSSKFDFWLSFGTAVTFLNLGHGGPGTLRLGGSFGAGFNLAHGYGYIRGRAAAVILPEKLDVEVSAQWTPPSASTGDYDEQNMRISAWYRLSEKSGRAAELYIETYSRVDSDPMTTGDREIIDGVGAGVGLSFF
jgi:hypothetical protein